MNLQSLLAVRVEAGKPVRVGLIGAGKFGSMFLAQVPSIKGLEVAVIADLDPERAKLACKTVGWDAARIARTQFVARGADAIADERVEIVIEATGIRSQASLTRSRPSRRASPSSWSMSKPTRWLVRCSRAGRARPA